MKSLKKKLAKLKMYHPWGHLALGGCKLNPFKPQAGPRKVRCPQSTHVLPRDVGARFLSFLTTFPDKHILGAFRIYSGVIGLPDWATTPSFTVKLGGHFTPHPCVYSVCLLWKQNQILVRGSDKVEAANDGTLEMSGPQIDFPSDKSWGVKVCWFKT